MQIRTLATLAVVIASASPALADMRAYQRSGYWTNYIGLADDKSPMCTMLTSSPDGQGVTIKYSSAMDRMWVQLYKKTWRIPSNTKISVEIGFDGGSFGVTDDGLGEPAGNLGGTVSTGIAAAQITDFIGQVGLAKKMWFRFGGTEAPWVVDMSGSREAASSFEACVARLKVSRPTQPYASQPQPNAAPPSQPFSDSGNQFGGDKFQPDRPKVKAGSDI